MWRKTYDKNQGQIARRVGSVWTVRGQESFAAATGGTLSPKTTRYCWRTHKCRNLWIPHAFFEGKKAWETCAMKGTFRTLKQIRQQYPNLFQESFEQADHRWNSENCCYTSKHPSRSD
jgi:hypothetical protein